MKAERFLQQINAVRLARGLPELDQLRVPIGEGGRGTPLDAAEKATGLKIEADHGHRKYLFQCETPELARTMASALGQPYDDATTAVALPKETEDFVIASAFDLVFVAHDGLLRGWIDPADTHPSLWELHLMPGLAYPPGHEPDQRSATDRDPNER